MRNSFIILHSKKYSEGTEGIDEWTRQAFDLVHVVYTWSPLWQHGTEGGLACHHLARERE